MKAYSEFVVHGAVVWPRYIFLGKVHVNGVFMCPGHGSSQHGQTLLFDNITLMTTLDRVTVALVNACFNLLG